MGAGNFKVLSGLAALAAVLAMPAAAGATPGDLDPGFGAAGVTQWSVGSSEFVQEIDVASTGEITAATVDSHPDIGVLTLTRLEPDGERDQSFGANGFVSRSVGRGAAVSIAHLTDGDTAVVFDAAGELRIWRLDPDGTPDDDFGGDGEIASPVDAGIVEVFPAPGGALLVAGGGYEVERIDASGTPDPAYTSEAPDPQFEAVTWGVSQAADGSIVMSGSAETVENLGVVVFEPDGDLDDSFATGGMASLALPLNEDTQTHECAGVPARAPDGDVLIFSTSADTLSRVSSGCVLRVDAADGTLDDGFGTAGVKRVGTGAQFSFNDGTVLADGTIVGVGTVEVYALPVDPVPDVFVAFLGSAGEPLGSFAGGGIVTTDVLDSSERGYALAVDPAGRLLVGGLTTAHQERPFASDAAVFAYELDPGEPDYDADGVSDASDTCPRADGPAPSGCVNVTRTLRLSRGGGNLIARINEPPNPRILDCAGGDVVTLFRVTANSRRKVAAKRMDAGHCAAGFRTRRLRAGTYVARVSAAIHPAVGRFGPAESNRIRIR